VNKDIQQLIRRLHDQGFRIRLARSGHYRITRGDRTITIPATPRGGRRTHANVRAALKRIGAEL
jgi:hypothetical protein